MTPVLMDALPVAGGGDTPVAPSADRAETLVQPAFDALLLQMMGAQAAPQDRNAGSVPESPQGAPDALLQAVSQAEGWMRPASPASDGTDGRSDARGELVTGPATVANVSRESVLVGAGSGGVEETADTAAEAVGTPSREVARQDTLSLLPRVRTGDGTVSVVRQRPEAFSAAEGVGYGDVMKGRGTQAQDERRSAEASGATPEVLVAGREGAGALRDGQSGDGIPAGTGAVPQTHHGTPQPSVMTGLHRAHEAPGAAPAGILPALRTPGWGDAFAAQVSMQVASGIVHVIIDVTPPELGPVLLDVDLRGNVANISFAAQQEDTRAAIRESLAALREQLSGSGVELGQTNVGTQLPQRGGRLPEIAGASGGEASHGDDESAPLPVRPERQSGLIDLYV